MADMLEYLEEQLIGLRETGLYKDERIIASPQGAQIQLNDGHEVINLCANNYLGLADHSGLIKEAQRALNEFGFGMASVRFICGTQSIHKKLERRISEFLQKEDTILYSSCFDANGGLFEAILTDQDAVISDELNHASIIDGIRLCKAQRFRYANNNMQDLEKKLQATQDARFRLIATDGVFSMDGIIANLADICELAHKYNAYVMVDDSHATGFIGKNGGGTPEYCGVVDQVDIVASTLGKALGGASGGFIAGRKPLVEWLRQRSRPYLFSNSLAPSTAAASLEVLDLIQHNNDLRLKLRENSTYFRAGLTQLGFKLVNGEHP
ncbi:MAG: glycine C-acetyltransferase, partial [Legionellales bacterium]|nr:glycine C-acetyltransferase [Legionellales bacterium]